MTVWNGMDAFPRDAAPVVATIGNYDGVHLGHRAILESVVAAARRRGLPSLVVTFDPHPLAIVAPSRRPRLLQTRRQKLDSLDGCGIGGVLILRFDATFAAMTGEEFFRTFLRGRVTPAAIHVGASFRFGHDRAGDVDLLCRIGSEMGFEVVGVPQVAVSGEIVSSSAVRRIVEDGDVERAARMLGRPFALAGEVVAGDGRGRMLDFPTANLDVENEMVPHRGVYVTESSVLSSRNPSVTNVGVRPTFGGETLVVETHLIDFDEDLLGERMEVRFLARLRDEKRFSGGDELADQIARDRAAAVAYFQGRDTAWP
ncbi:MAG: bifunctional riboflavin kinase/FAD synthetase [Acidobacteriia bacterium]|nr:bifunctional riboflavin kinase/FAD synthetase [Terriglobia bacterium]